MINDLIAHDCCIRNYTATDKPDSGHHPFEVGKIISNYQGYSSHCGALAKDTIKQSFQDLSAQANGNKTWPLAKCNEQSMSNLHFNVNGLYERLLNLV